MNKESHITYSSDKNDLEKLEVSGFFVGWPNPPSDQTLKKILHNSQHIVLAIDNGVLVGFINALSDNVLSAYIPLLEVLPSYQGKGKGIGKVLVEKMKDNLKNIYMMDICCDEDVIPFYEKQGFKRGHSMFKRNYEFQSGK